MGAANGDGSIQQTKKQLAVTYVLAAARTVAKRSPISTVQTIAAVVDMAAGTAPGSRAVRKGSHN